MNNQQTILIIDDEIQIRKILRISLETKEYKIIEAENGKDGITKAAMHQPQGIILDLGLPDSDGLNILKQLREWYKLAIIILSVRNSEKDIISALDSGADDYLTKPFNIGELLARLRTAFRHHQQVESFSVVRFGSIKIDFSNRMVYKNEEVLKFTSTEYSLLSLLVQNRGKVLTHRFILENVWGHGFANETQYLRVYIAQLRKKIEEDAKLIITESGIGYRLLLPEN
jgi:two-component system KDP operon response regulator KdpE